MNTDATFVKLIIAGPRYFNDEICPQNMIELYVSKIESITQTKVEEIVSGGVRGVDYLGEEYARLKNIKLKKFEADFSKGNFAGRERNEKMSFYADSLLLLWDGYSSGSMNMLANARKNRLLIYSKIVEHWD